MCKHESNYNAKYYDLKQITLGLKRICLLSLVVGLLFTNCVNGQKIERKGLDKLIYQIFVSNGYNELVRPVNNETGLTHVSTELKLLGIDLDEKYQELVSTVWVEMTWEDSRLKWDPLEYENVTEITLPVSKLWIPDIVLQNGVGRNEYLNEFKYFNPWISHTGIITWVPEVRLHTRCLIKVSDFPFDTQCCEINFYSWAHTIKQMEIKQFGDKNVTNITHLSHNTEWEVYSTCALSKIIVTSEELHWWMSSYIIYIKRHTAYHIYSLLMPCFVLSMLSMLLFLLPPDSGEKVTLGVTILLAFFVNSLVVSNYTPEATSEMPVIGVYYVFNIGFVSVSVATAVGVLNFHFRGHKVNRVPVWLMAVLLIKKKCPVNKAICDTSDDEMRACSCCKMNPSCINLDAFDGHSYECSVFKDDMHLADASTPTSGITSKKDGDFKVNTIVSSHKHEPVSSAKIKKPVQGLSTSKLFSLNEFPLQKNIKIVDIVKDNHGEPLSRIVKAAETKPMHKHRSSVQKLEEGSRTIEKILKLIKRSIKILERTNLKSRATQEIYDEWKEVATRIDFLLFLTSLFIILVIPIFLFGRFFIQDNTNLIKASKTCICLK